MNIAMISRWHVHADEYANALAAAPGCKIAAVYHEDAESGRAWADKLGCQFVANLDDIWADAAIDAVAVNSATNLHPDIICAAAKAGKAVFTEKVLALTNPEAERIERAIAQGGKTFVISFPHLTRPELIKAKQIMDSGALGTVGYARVRNVHNGSSADWLPAHFYSAEQCGGGAMIDLGAHPMYTLAWLLGEPITVQSTFTNVTDRPVEDNAVSVLTFKNGAIGVSETGFVSSGNPYTLEISGTDGALMIHNGLRYSGKDTGGKWVEVTDLPAEQPLPVQQFADVAQRNGQIEEFGIEKAVRLTKIMDAAYRSFRDGGAAKV